MINNDTALQGGVADAFQQYNTEQFTPVDVPGQNYKVRFAYTALRLPFLLLLRRRADPFALPSLAFVFFR